MNINSITSNLYCIQSTTKRANSSHALLWT